jgi:hypothetical protein
MPSAHFGNIPCREDGLLSPTHAQTIDGTTTSDSKTNGRMLSGFIDGHKLSIGSDAKKVAVWDV